MKNKFGVWAVVIIIVLAVVILFSQKETDKGSVIIRIRDGDFPIRTTLVSN